MSRGAKPIGARVLSRLTASWWRHCCALCVVHVPCGAWAFDDEWPADTRNCVLHERIDQTAPAGESRFVGRLPPGPRGRHALAPPMGYGGGEEPSMLITYDIPQVGPWDGAT